MPKNISDLMQAYLEYCEDRKVNKGRYRTRYFRRGEHQAKPKHLKTLDLNTEQGKIAQTILDRPKTLGVHDINAERGTEENHNVP